MYLGILSHELDNNFDVENDSKFGGDPIWLCAEEPKGLNLKCSSCGKGLTFLFQLSTSYDKYIRVLYIFCCMKNIKCNMNKKNWVCVKGKKEIVDIVESVNNNNVEILKPLNNSDVPEVNQNNNIHINSNNKSIFHTNDCEEKKQHVFNLLHDKNIKREEIAIQSTNSKEEKLIDWNSLFSNNTKKVKENGSLFSNSISEKLLSTNIAQTECYQHIPVSNANINNNIYSKLITQNNTSHVKENGPNGYDKLIKFNKPNKSHNKNVLVTEKNNKKLPSYYICLIEDDEDCGKDYLYEHAKKMYKKYEQSKQNEQSESKLEGEEYINTKKNDNSISNSIYDEEECFENDFNGCVKLFSYLSKNYNQILRYSYKGKFLYMYKATKNSLKKNMICTQCKNKLVFEVQFFSTFVYQIEQKVKAEKNSFLKNMLNNFNVGNVIIFTCEQDCVVIDDMYSYEHIELEIF
ncbi:conserved protein, unknown function [Hepatocystis sp. ex Piliocolobus tephrosceles]|nr:conserved protein, unknown function [Hepatocystis sp. ex Piliocolobus tephrosceles]